MARSSLLYTCFFVFIFLSDLFLISNSLALENPKKTIIKQQKEIQVHPVSSPKDEMNLADLRYQEWMSREADPPSLQAFRMATSEIMRERSVQGAIAFLATTKEGTAVGSAELSPVEFQNTGCNTNKWLYVTDVVTCSNHRRLGIGSALMTAMENHFVERSERIYLHVSPDNLGALKFYQQRGYNPVAGRKNDDHDFDQDQLAKNAGTTGQLLLYKALMASRSRHSSKKKRKRSQGGKGFG